MNIKRYYFIVWFLIFSNLSAQSIKSYIDKYKDIAVQEMHLYNIPASITLAQGILESGHGSSLLAKEANNHFGAIFQYPGTFGGLTDFSKKIIFFYRI